MTASTPYPKDGKEAAFLAIWRSVDHRTQRAISDGIDRLHDGQPVEDCFTEMFVELGDVPGIAREKVRKLLRDNNGRWLRHLI